MRVLGQLFCEGSKSPTGSEEIRLFKNNGDTALIPRPTGSATVKQTLFVPSMAILVGEPPIRGLLLARHASIGPVGFLKVPKVPLGPESEEG